MAKAAAVYTLVVYSVTQPPILLVGEAYGEHEARLGGPFVGASGVLLLRMLGDAGVIDLNSADKSCLSKFYSTNDPKWTERVWKAHPNVRATNVFNIHPHNNDLEQLCGPRGDSVAGYPAISGSKYIRAEFEPELERLQGEILSHNPNLIVCLGNTPLWALAGRTGIKKWRGTTLESTHTVAGYKLLPTYHPTAVLRGPELRPIVLADLDKALRESAYPDIRRPHRDIWIEPDTGDIVRFIREIISERQYSPLSVDIETSGTRITCIGFGYSDVAIVVPFDDSRTKNGNYWSTLEAERTVWQLIRGVLEDERIPKLFQNGLYDIAFLARSVGIKVMGAEEDTMLLHHALQPEMEKSLGFLGSVYADEGAWKHMRTKTKTIKRDA